MTKLHITKEHTGKMKGMQSLSTAYWINENCARHKKALGKNGEKPVCEKCYVNRMYKMYGKKWSCFEKNTKILTESILPTEDLPVINAAYFRFEAFGDLNNTTQVMNYFNICKANPDVNFALWTKNPGLITPVADQKPDNLQIVLSSLFMNEELDESKVPEYVDKIFTVYDKETIERDDVEINCGARSCLKCHKCYKKGGARYIREKLKK